MAFRISIGIALPGRTGSLLGPYLSNGRVFVVAIQSSDQDILVYSHDDADPLSAGWAEDDAANAPVLTDTARSVSSFQEGSVIHIAHQEATTGRVGYDSFNMSTRLWVVVDETVQATSDADNAGLYVSLSARSDGDVIVEYAGDTDSAHGAKQRVDYRRREGGTWSSAIAVDNGGVQNWYVGAIVRGSSDRMHFFLHSTTNGLFQRTLTSANVFETFPGTSIDSSLPVVVTGVVGFGVSYDDGGTQRVRAPYTDANLQISIAEFDSADTPSPSTTVDASDFDVQVFVHPACGLAADGTTLHLMYVRESDDDLYRDENPDDAGWGTDVEVEDETAAITSISCNVFTRDGIPRLAYMYEEAGVFYGEVDLPAGAVKDPIMSPGIIPFART